MLFYICKDNPEKHILDYLTECFSKFSVRILKKQMNDL